MKSDFHTDHDAANTTTGAEAMTSATGVELDMPIKPVRDHGDHHAMSVRALPKPPTRDRARLSVAVDVGHADLWRPVHGSRRPREPTHVHLSIGQLRWMSVDCIQMSARVGFALRSLVPPIMETITLDRLCITRADTLFYDGWSQDNKTLACQNRFCFARAMLPRANEVS